MSSTSPHKNLIALVDCNNFYASCERVFNPRLEKRPVVVLSNNDGCIIARSKEAKELGIPMGAPIYQYEDLCKKFGVHIASSNFALYGDLSRRVMQVLSSECQDIEIYSVDEAFLLLHPSEGIEFAKRVREKVLQWTGIPVSIGISTTKTLSKLAAVRAKKRADGVHILIEENEINAYLKDLPVTEIWGIGRKMGEHLNRLGVLSALDFKYAEDGWIRKHLGIVLLRTLWELRGKTTIDFEEASIAKKSITTSRSFGEPITQLSALHEAISHYAVRAAEKLREEGSLAVEMDLFLMHKAKGEDVYLYQSAHIALREPTDYTPTLISHAKEAIARLFQEGLLYRKAGIILCHLVSKSCYQGDLFVNENFSINKERLMKVMDGINAQYGYSILKWAAEGVDKPGVKWQMKKTMRSPAYTTNWDELLVVRA